MTLVQIRLFRDCFQTPWGFRLQGGKDLNQPLTIQRVFANTPSENELHRGDVIVAINGRDTSNFSHKAAQDAISGGGGQIELLVSRPPPGQVNIQPLSPVKDTRAPAFPNLKPPHINIPVQSYKHPNQASPSRIIPVSPQKPSPRPAPPKPAPKPAAAPPPNMAAGHIPTKITMNKYGGGGMDFGISPKSPPVHGYRPVPGPSMDHTDFNRPQNQFSAPQSPPQFNRPAAPAPAGEGGVAEEEYSAVSDRRKQFMKDSPRPPNAWDEDDYPTAPVWERRRMFGKKRSPPRAVHRPPPQHSKPAPSFGKPRQGEAPVSFGVDYTKPHTMRQQPKQQKPQRERPPAVNARRAEDETDYSWSNTLRGDGRNLKPWEIEAMEAQKYQDGSVDLPYRPSMAPATAPKPQLSPQRGGQRSVSPYNYSHQPTKPPARSPNPPQHPSHASNYGFAGGASQTDGPNAKFVHLQYNSPMGLYSQDNVQDAYVGQTQGQALSPSAGQPKKPAQPGDRDWNDSYVYQMIHSEETTSSSMQNAPGQQPQGQSVKTTRVTQESKVPGQAPQRHVTETVQRGRPGGPGGYVFDNAIGMSDF